MQDREPTIRGRVLGEGLRRAMANARLTGKSVAHQLQWDESKVSRMLSGKRPGSEVDTSAILALCRVHGEERDHLLGLARDQQNHGFLRVHATGRPAATQLAEMLDNESLATKIVNFQDLLVPGLLQTKAYATEIIAGGVNVPRAGVQERVDLRMTRQLMLSDRGAKTFVFYLNEFALRLPVGGREVMSGQLHKLLEMLVRPNVIVRVLPTELGVNAGRSGAFMYMEFADFHPVIYLEADISHLLLEKEEEATAYQRIISSLDATALDVRRSRDLIARLAIELYGDEEGAPFLAQR